MKLINGSPGVSKMNMALELLSYLSYFEVSLILARIKLVFFSLFSIKKSNLFKIERVHQSLLTESKLVRGENLFRQKIQLIDQFLLNSFNGRDANWKTEIYLSDILWNRHKILWILHKLVCFFFIYSESASLSVSLILSLFLSLMVSLMMMFCDKLPRPPLSLYLKVSSCERCALSLSLGFGLSLFFGFVFVFVFEEDTDDDVLW